jgi:hypothetical protein
MFQKVYALYVDTEKCADYRLGIFDADFNGTPLPLNWKLPRLKVGNPKWPLNDFVQGHPSAPFVSDRAKAVLEPVVGDAVQFRSIGQVLKRDYYILNVVAVINCLDEGKSRIVRSADGRILSLRQAVFDQPRLFNAVIFKVPQDTGKIFVTDRFIEAVMAYRLTGVGFEPSDNVGVGVINNAFPSLPLRSGQDSQPAVPRKR